MILTMTVTMSSSAAARAAHMHEHMHPWLEPCGVAVTGINASVEARGIWWGAALLSSGLAAPSAAASEHAIGCRSKLLPMAMLR